MEAIARSVQSQTARVRHFCANALCPDWRVMFIGIATWLLYEAALVATPKSTGISAQQGELALLYGLLCFAALWVALRPMMPEWLEHAVAHMPPILKIPLWRGLFLLLMLVGAGHNIVSVLPDAVHGVYHNDAIAFVHADAELLRDGRNPYTADDAFWTAVAKWPKSLATPLLGSKAFGNNPRAYPTARNLSTVLQAEIANPKTRTAHNFDPQTVHNYPAGIVWLALPLIWAGIPSVIWLNIIMFLVMIAIILARAPQAMRAPLSIVLLANPSFILFDLTTNFDVCCIVFVVAAWQWMPNEKSSALLLGVACAVKQLAWFVVPFYLLEILRREGWQSALRRSFWMALAFIVPNLPFILKSPTAWLHSMLIPMTDPMFPLGLGPITLGLSGVVPLGTPHAWTLVMLGLMVVLFVFQWLRPTITADGLYLALLPLWLSWRSPMNYLALVPVLVAWVAVSQCAQGVALKVKVKSSTRQAVRAFVGSLVSEEKQEEREPELVSA